VGWPLERLAPELARTLEPWGVLIASGFLEDAVGGLRRAFEAAGLRVEGVVEDGGWRGLLARRA